MRKGIVPAKKHNLNFYSLKTIFETMLKKLILLALFFLTGYSASLWAQGSIQGRITDGVSKKPLAFATVNLLRSDSSVVSGYITQEDGLFHIEQIPAGTYLLRISFLGYQTLWTPNVSIKKGEQIQLNTLIMQPQGITKKEVIITAERSVITSNAEKKVFTVDPLLNPGASASDVLQQIPSVTTDQDGNINLRGEGAVTILIDGKPSALSGNGGSLLQQINASSIEKIEVITNPSSKYDADGSNGIINIILKKDSKRGSNALINTSYGLWDKTVLGLNGNYRSKKINTFINANYRYYPVYGRHQINRDYALESNPFLYSQKENSMSYPHNLSFRAGIDINLNEKHSLSLSTLWGSEHQTDDETYTYIAQDAVGSYLLHRILKNRIVNPSFNFEHTLNYRRQFTKPSQILTAAAAWSRDNDYKTIDGNNYNLLPDGTWIDSTWIGSHTIYDNKNDIVVAQVDYEQPLIKDWKLESGLKGTFRFIDNRYFGERNEEGIWMADTSSSSIKYRDQIYAAYGMLSGNIHKLNVRMGLRAEQSYRSFSVLQRSDDFNARYLNFFPSLFLTRKISDHFSVFASYTKRINRPSVFVLNPYPFNNDPNNQMRGNPDVLPEMIHAFELGSHWNSTAHSLSATLYMRQTLNKIQRIRVTEGFISTVQIQNIQSTMNTGAEGMWRAEWARWVNTTLSGNLYSININSDGVGGLVRSQGWAWTGKLLTIMRPAKGFIDLQISGYYNSPFITLQGRILSMYSSDISLKKDILKKHGSITVGLNDIFNTRRFRVNSQYENISQSVTYKRQSRIFLIGFSYRFGGNENSMQRKKTLIDDFGGGGGGE